jgi:hypothetical protein
MASVGKMRTALPAVAMLRSRFRYCELSPTVFKEGEFRFFFFSREESRPHVHVSHPDGEAKFWLIPTVELARNIGLSSSRVKEAERLATTRQQEIIDAWNNHFKG